MRSGSNFSALQPSHWVDVCFVFLLWCFYSGGAELTVFSCGKHKHTQTYCELIGSGGADTHTDRLSHFSFFLFYPLP